MDTDQLVTNTIIDYFGLSDIKNKFKGGAMIAAEAAEAIGPKVVAGLEKKGAKGLEKEVTQKKTKDKPKNVKGKLKDWATEPGPGKPIGDNSVFDNTESLLKKLVQIFSLVFYIITLPLMPWIWMFKKTRSSMDTTYKKSLRPL
jgi:hypothetical protein